jgi:DNA-binding SARP family transcriptional activator
MVELRVLGGLDIRSSHGRRIAEPPTQPKRQAVLLYLTLAVPGGFHSRESLMALLWPESDDASARHSLRNALHSLRRSLGEDILLARGESQVAVNPDAIHCDALKVRGLLAAGRWEEALAGWTGDPLPGFHVSGAPEFERWLDEQRSTLKREIVAAGWKRADELEAAGNMSGAARSARRAVDIGAPDEAGVRRLMRLLDAAGDRVAALDAYDRFADRLAAEYETEPSVETSDLMQVLRRRTPAIPPASATSPGSPPPAVAGTRSRVVSRRAVFTGAVAAGAIFAVLASDIFGHSPSLVARAPEADGTGRLPQRFREDTASYSSYLRGMTLVSRWETMAARDTFQALIDRRPLYAPGYQGLARAYTRSIFDWHIGRQLAPEDAWPASEAAARNAIALDSGFALPYGELAAAAFYWRWDFRRADTLLRRSLALAPGDPDGHHRRAAWFRWQGEFDSAVVEMGRAHELDPLRPLYSQELGWNLFYARRYQEAEEQFRLTSRQYAQWNLGAVGIATVRLAEGHLRDALVAQREFLAGIGDTTALRQFPLVSSDAQADSIWHLAWRAELVQLDSSVRAGDAVIPSRFALAHARLRDTDATLRWLDSAYAKRDAFMEALAFHPDLDFLRGDPRYRAWLATLPWLRGRPCCGGTSLDLRSHVPSASR